MYDNNEVTDDWNETSSVSSLGEETVISKTKDNIYYKLNVIVDKGYRKIKNGKKAKSVEYFVTNGTVGNCIRDAITGARYNYFVGSKALKQPKDTQIEIVDYQKLEKLKLQIKNL